MDTANGSAADHAFDSIRDQQLISELRQLQPIQHPVMTETGHSYQNPDVLRYARSEYTAQDLDRLESHLFNNGAFNIPIARGTLVLDGVTHIIPFVAATETDANHGEMSSMLYLRDHIQVSRAYMELYLTDPNRYEDEGEMDRDLLHSALLLMSTPSQLERFERVVKLGTEAGQADWPQISLYFNDLEGNNPNGWRNKQDTLQMLGHLTFDAIDRGYIDVADLSERNRQYLGYLVPFLMAAGYPCYENSGSWEEITAVRTSVMAVETSLLYKIQQHIHNDDPDNPNYGFLRDAYKRYSPDGAPDEIDEALQTLIEKGLTALGERMPFESSELDHDLDSIKYREADAALVYVLMYDLPQLLADNHIPIGRNAEILSETEIEEQVLAQLDTLIDPLTGGMKRYKNDSYQRTNFHTHVTQREITKIKQYIRDMAARSGTEPNLDEKQRRRDEFVADGREAVWTHPVSQLAAWAAKRCKTAADPSATRRYNTLSTKYLNQALRLITGERQYTAALQEDGRYGIERLPANKLPECFITYRDAKGDIIVASPHTPLNWSTAMLREATGLLGAAARQDRIRSIGAYCI